MQINIKTLYSGKTGELLRKHIEDNIDELDRVSDIKIEDSIEKIGIEVIARNRSIKKLKEIFKLAEPEQETKTLLRDNFKRNGL